MYTETINTLYCTVKLRFWLSMFLPVNYRGLLFSLFWLLVNFVSFFRGGGGVSIWRRSGLLFDNWLSTEGVKL